MIVDRLIEFIDKCPYLDDLVSIKADYCNENAISYCIETSSSSKVVETYIDGSKVLKLPFMFSSKEIMSDYDDTNVENMIFYENFSNWIEEQNSKGNLPVLGGNLSAISIEVVSHGYVVQSEADRGRYEIQLKLKYYKKA